MKAVCRIGMVVLLGVVLTLGLLLSRDPGAGPGTAAARSARP